jgi:3-hydroxyisobutyrate dehydrogenase-like beta-hydroxyacid dehydrogenase
MTARETNVTLIGQGPMGRAMARALCAQGYAVTVWNRTAARAADAVTAGATLAATPAEAVAASELVILSLTDYQAMYDILGEGSGLAGRTLVNLSSDTPERTRAAAAWANVRGAGFLTGGVMVPAPSIGTEASFVYYSGPRALLTAHEPALRAIGSPRYLGDDPGLSQLYYQAQLDVFLTTLSSVLHATALVGSAGVSAGEFIPEALGTLRLIEEMLATGETARQIDRGVHPGLLSTTRMMGATADHIVLASQDARIDLELPRAVQSQYARAIAAGRGDEDWTSLIDILRAR